MQCFQDQHTPVKDSMCRIRLVPIFLNNSFNLLSFRNATEVVLAQLNYNAKECSRVTILKLAEIKPHAARSCRPIEWKSTKSWCNIENIYLTIVDFVIPSSKGSGATKGVSSTPSLKKRRPVIRPVCKGGETNRFLSNSTCVCGEGGGG